MLLPESEDGVEWPVPCGWEYDLVTIEKFESKTWEGEKWNSQSWVHRRLCKISTFKGLFHFIAGLWTQWFFQMPCQSVERIQFPMMKFAWTYFGCSDKSNSCRWRKLIQYCPGCFLERKICDVNLPTEYVETGGYVCDIALASLGPWVLEFEKFGNERNIQWDLPLGNQQMVKNPRFFISGAGF